MGLFVPSNLGWKYSGYLLSKYVDFRGIFKSLIFQGKLQLDILSNKTEESSDNIVL